MVISAFGPTPQRALLCDQSDEQVQSEVDAWVARELAPLIPSAARLIGVDGLDGVGKSTIARSLARCCARGIVEVDSYLRRNEDRYLAALDLIRLEGDVRAEEKLIVEGCLLHAVMAKVGLNPDFCIYVVKTSQMRGHSEMESVDEHELLFGSKSAAEIIAHEEDQLRRWAEVAPEFIDATSANLSGLTKELIAYHRDFSPHRRADLILRAVRIS